MWAVKYLGAVWAALVVYAVSSFFVGAMGVSAYDQLESKRLRQAGNIDTLRSINGTLTGMKDALQYDNDSISVYARELGFGSGGERFVRIVGIRDTQRRQIEVGQVFRPGPSEYISDKTLRITSLCVGAFLALLLAIIDLLRFIRDC
jgi:cell division protein FtsB